jgi:hypothetical protein
VAKRRLWLGTTIGLILTVAVSAWLLPPGRERSPVVFAAARPAESDRATRDERDRALRRARVWRPVDLTRVDLKANPADPLGTLSGPIVRCRYLSRPAHGTTAKFDCVLPDGEVVKVKYGHTGEIHAELAASRLLTALGFGADRMYLIPRVRCYGCLRTPFYTNLVLDKVHLREIVTGTVPEDRYTDFEWVAVERPFPGREIETADTRGGWAWYELESIDGSVGATHAELDALRLAAIVLAHWDNKAANQRLVCLSQDDATTPCSEPFAFIQDLGATFGPNKVDLDHWKAVPIWKDAARCVIGMQEMPYGGGTFQDTRISEEGRQLLARELAMLNDTQIATLFAAAHFPEFIGSGSAADPNAWARAFRDKVRQITDAGPCPKASSAEWRSVQSS